MIQHFLAGAMSIIVVLLLWYGAGRINLINEVHSGLKILPTLLWLLMRQTAGTNGSAVEVFMKSVRKYPHKHALVFTATQTKYTFTELNSEINRSANWLIERGGIGKGAIVALMLDNSPEFIILEMACLKIGAVAALINPHTKGSSLLHVLNSADPSCLLFHEKYGLELSEVLPELNPHLRAFVVGSNTRKGTVQPKYESADFESASEAEPDMKFRTETKVTDIALLIYTSGTTGLPKPSSITHARLCFGSVYFASFANLSAEDRVYTCLPLYHSAATLIGWGSCMAFGCTMVLSPKYSSSRFMKDCAEYDVTVIQYIGELARFLLNTQPTLYDTSHNIRIAMGNGLRPDVWKAFKSRFNIPEVCEFYASTEGNANMVNHQVGMQDGVGAVGRMGPLFQKIQQIYLVRYDPITELPMRDKNGRCIPCRAGETGELVAQITSGSLVKDFKGYYRNADATNSKIITNVFRDGDRFFRTGDLLVVDKNLYYYFVDRIGDSFRWKGENVSTFEVAEVLNSFPAIKEANVYGVQVPGAEGCAGMAAVHVHGQADEFTGEGLAEFLATRLPKYSIPVWIRVLDDVQDVNHTLTFKQMKVDFRKQAFNINIISNTIFWLKPGATSYSRFEHDDFNKVLQGNVF